MQTSQSSQHDLPKVLERTLPLITNLTKSNSSGFRPGIISRFQPGVHEVSLKDYRLKPVQHLDRKLLLLQQSQRFQPHQQLDDLVEQTSGMSSETFNIFGQTNTCSVNAYGTHLRIHSPGYDLNLPRPRMRPPDNSNIHVAHALQFSSSPIHPQPCGNPDDKVHTVLLTADSTNCVEAPGLAVYAAPGNGKSYAQANFTYRCADTDFMYDPDAVVVRKLCNLGIVVFTNMMELVVNSGVGPLGPTGCAELHESTNLAVNSVPLVVFLPTKDMLSHRMCEQMSSVSRATVAEWVADIHAKVDEIRAKKQEIEFNKQCVMIVHVSEPSEYLSDIFKQD